jgi:predicted TIM-barrel enzyme
MGTSVKIDGDTFKPIDVAKAKRFMDRANEIRSALG